MKAEEMKRPTKQEFTENLTFRIEKYCIELQKYVDKLESQNKELSEENDKVTKLINAFYFLWRNMGDKRLDEIMDLISELKTQ